MKHSSRGFTVIEILFVVLFVIVASVVYFLQRQNVQTAAEDASRKTAINAMYYGLEEVFYPAHSYYPATINADTLPSVDPALFTDPAGHAFTDSQSNYHYQGTNCSNDKCKSYTLRATLVNEADYVKSSKHS